ncbi:protein disulfide-isomerase precursor [Entomophthora muscae]|uniref:Protein disulfide-isomerase n=1 Tax=Entomophthora muscae TaxID=34485 RepID=A0ACC2T7J5_9FUNG|nr:protein disulfide-isomerase precursor [Entomophthora muscae]
MKLINNLVSAILFAGGYRGESTDSSVLNLSADSFKDAIAEHKIILVKFFAPWCGHCKTLAPQYETAASLLKETPLKLAEVDCTVHKSVCDEYQVQGFPTLKLFNEGEVSDYDSARETTAIVKFMRNQLLPTVSELSSEDFKSFLEPHQVVMVGYFSDADSDEAKVFAEVAKKHRNEYVFGSISDEALAKEHEAKFPGVVIYKKFDDGKDKYEGEFTTEELTKFLKTSATPLIDDLSPNNFQKYMESKLPLAYIFVESVEDRDSYDASLKDLAKKVKGKVNFVFINATTYGRHAESINLETKFPTFGIQQLEPSGKFPIDQSSPLTADAIVKHVEDFVADKLKPSIKSEPIPEDNNGPVTVLVGDSFSDIAYDTAKDVLVEFYASWCGHCKKLAPIYDQLGEAYKSNDKIVIAKMEVIENDLPYKAGFEVTGFPTIKLFKANTNEIVDFEGDRTVDGFIEFLKANAANDATASVSEPASEDDESDDSDEL